MKYLNGNVMSELERMLQNAFVIAKISDKSPARLAREWLGEIRSAASNDFKREGKLATENWCIIRYRDDKFDCVWKSGLRKDVAEKKAKELNNDYHKNYGFYIAEPCG